MLPILMAEPGIYEHVLAALGHSKLPAFNVQAACCYFSKSEPMQTVWQAVLMAW